MGKYPCLCDRRDKAANDGSRGVLDLAGPAQMLPESPDDTREHTPAVASRTWLRAPHAGLRATCVGASEAYFSDFIVCGGMMTTEPSPTANNLGSPYSLLHDFDFLVGQPIQVVDDVVNQVVGALYFLVECLRSPDELQVPIQFGV